MKIVLLERNSAGTDVPVDCFYELGEVTSYPNTVTVEEVAERVGDADVIVCNKAPMREESLKNCPNVKLICELATGYDNCDLEYCKSRGIKVANVVDYSTRPLRQTPPDRAAAARAASRPRTGTAPAWSAKPYTPPAEGYSSPISASGCGCACGEIPSPALLSSW